MTLQVISRSNMNQKEMQICLFPYRLPLYTIRKFKDHIALFKNSIYFILILAYFLTVSVSILLLYHFSLVKRNRSYSCIVFHIALKMKAFDICIDPYRPAIRIKNSGASPSISLFCIRFNTNSLSELPLTLPLNYLKYPLLLQDSSF